MKINTKSVFTAIEFLISVAIVAILSTILI